MKKTQCMKILQHMKEHGSITGLEAINLYGCQRLAARISDLRKEGVAIKSERVTGRDRNGEPTSYAVYSLAEVNG